MANLPSLLESESQGHSRSKPEGEETDDMTLQASIQRAGPEGRGCAAAGYVFAGLLFWSLKVFFGALLPNYHLVVRANDYKPAKFVVLSYSYMSLKNDDKYVAMARGKVAGKVERLDLDLDGINSGKGDELARKYPVGTSVDVLIDNKLSDTDQLVWPERILLGTREDLSGRSKEFWRSVVYLFAPWAVALILSVTFTPKKLTPP